MHHIVENGTCLDAKELVRKIHSDLGEQPFIVDIADAQGSLFQHFIDVTDRSYREYSGWASPGLAQQIFHTHNLPTILATTGSSPRSLATLVIDIEVARQIASTHNLELNSFNAIEMDAEISTASFNLQSQHFKEIMLRMQNDVDDTDRIRWDNIPAGYSRFALVPSKMHLHAQEIAPQSVSNDDLRSELRWAFLPSRNKI